MKKTKALRLIVNIQIELDALTKKLQHTKEFGIESCFDSASQILDWADDMQKYFLEELMIHNNKRKI